MKRKKSLIILIAVVVVLCCVIIIEQAVTKHVDSINTTDEIILSIEQDSLTSVTWTYEEETLTFDQTDGVWYDSGDAEFPVDQDKMEDFLSWFEETHATFIIEDVEDYSQYGLEEPQCTITLTTEDGDTTVSVGNYSTMDEQRYIEIGDGKVYLVEEDILESVTTDRDEFMQHDETPSIVTLDSLTVSGEVQLNAVYDEEGKYAYTDSYNYYQVEDDGTYLILDDSLVESYLSSLSYLSLTNYMTYTASSEDLSEYGLDDPAYTITVNGTVEVEAEEEETEESDEDEEETEESETETEAVEVETEDVEFVIYIGVVTEEAEDEDEEDTITAYIRVGDSEIIYQLDESDYEALIAVSYDDLRPANVLSLDWDEVTGISFTVDDETYEIDVMDAQEYAETYGTEDEAEEAEGCVYLIDEQEIDLDEVMDAVDELSIDSFTDEADVDTLEMSMTFTLSDEDYSSVEMDIYRYDSESCLVVVDGESVGYVSRSLMVELRECLTSIVLGLV